MSIINYHSMTSRDMWLFGYAALLNKENTEPGNTKGGIPWANTLAYSRLFAADERKKFF